MSLSEKREWSYDGDGTETTYYKEEDVKQSIKELKEYFEDDIYHTEVIDEIFGEGLV